MTGCEEQLATHEEAVGGVGRVATHDDPELGVVGQQQLEPAVDDERVVVAQRDEGPVVVEDR